MGESPPHESTEAAPEAGPSAGRRIMGAAGWIALGQVLVRVLSLGSSLVLTRLLLPEVYGVMEIVFVIHTGLHMFSDLGIDQSIVHSRRGDDPAFLNTAWTVQVLRGVVLFIAACVLARPIAQAYGRPEVGLLIPAVALTAVFDGLLSITVKRYTRHLRLGPVVWLEVGMQATVVVVQVLVALVWPSPWALVMGALLGSGGKSLCSHLLLEKHPHRLAWDRAAVRELYSFGSWIFASTALTFLNLTGDRLLLGAFVPMSQLGVYAIATRLRDALNGFRGQIVRSVMYPFMAERNRQLDDDDPEGLAKLATLYYRARLRVDALFVTATGALIAFGGPLIDILYTDAYLAAGSALMILSVQAFLQAVGGSAEAILTAVGDTKQYFLQTVGRSAVIVIGIPFGWWVGGFWGVVWATALSELPAVWVVLWRMNQRGLVRPWLEARSLLFLGLGVAIGFLLRWLAQPLLG